MRRFIIKAHDKVTCARIQCKAGRASQILTCAWTTRESCENEGSNSIGAAWGLRFCILKQHSWCGCCLSSDHTLGCKCRDLSEWVASPSFITSRKCPVKLSDKVNKSIVNSPIHLGRAWKSILISMLYFTGKRERDFFINGIMEKKEFNWETSRLSCVDFRVENSHAIYCMTLSSTEKS